ncbi:Hsp70 family protein [Deinococcus aquaticus]|uniref:Hsp70 family protein n=1 Tax=Deinococcus aquaticus TaxID=328692 RepID=UPI003F4624B0
MPDLQVLQIDQETDEGLYTHTNVPSVVAVTGGQVRVGKGARDLRMQGLIPNKNLFAETKNHMGTSRTFPAGERGLQTPRDVAACILQFLHQVAGAESSLPVARSVVTVPASFQTPQRDDTVRAALNAGLHLSDGELLDEPVAAFLDYLMTHGQDLVPQLSQPRSLVVFDFGGGTCDIAVFRLCISEGHLDVAPLAVSRYHRLGGADIDLAIVHEVLIPQLAAQNQLGPFELTFTQKKQLLEPALLSSAEGLKIKLNKALQRQRAFGKSVAELSVTLPGTVNVKIGERTVTLRDPSLNTNDLERVLQPLLDPDALYPFENEYRSIQSIFQPLDDALERANLEPSEVDFCLLVGGASQLQGVQDALAEYFRPERLLIPDEEFMQTAIARGAAWHALARALGEPGLIRQVSNETISLRTDRGLLEIVPRSAPLPFPTNALYAEVTDKLVLPQSVAAGDALEMRIELMAGGDRVLTSRKWKVQGPAAQGTPLTLLVSLNLNGVLDLDLQVQGRETERLQVTLENPTTHTVNPAEERQVIEQLEEELRSGTVDRSKQVSHLDRLSRLYGELGQYEKALDLMKRSLKLHGRPSSAKLNMMGIFCRHLGDDESMEKWYRQSAAASQDNTALFNLALALRDRKKHQQAYDTMQDALARGRDVEDLALGLQLAQLTGRTEERAALAVELAQSLQAPAVQGLTDWQLSWALFGARQLPDANIEQAVLAEQRRRNSTPSTLAPGILPQMKD